MVFFQSIQAGDVQHESVLLFPPLVYGLIALFVFASLAIVVFSFRHVALRSPVRSGQGENTDHTHGGH